jgi:DNA-binding transcriptional regulator PaaX
MSFKLKSPTIKILSLLKDASPNGLDYKALSHFLLKLKYARLTIHNSLGRLTRNGWISTSGRKRSMTYRITDRGLSGLYRIETKDSIKEIEDYLFITAGGIDQ